MWLLTVASLTTSCAAISAFDIPRAISASTSASRAVSPPGTRGAAAPFAPSWPAAMASRRCCWTAGSMTACALRVDDRAVVGVGGEHEDLDARVMVAKAAGCLDPVAVRHPQVHQHHVRPGQYRQGQGLVAVGRGGHDLDAVDQAEQRPEALADHALVIGDQDADDRAHGGTHNSTL